MSTPATWSIASAASATRATSRIRMIISESGRAIAAHHSVLIFNILGTFGARSIRGHRSRGRPVRRRPGSCRSRCATCSMPTRNIDERRLVECYHDALTAREQVLQMFNLGLLSLEFRGLAERLYWASCARIRDCCRKARPGPRGARGSRGRARRIPTSAISRSSSRCPTAGPSTSCSRSCRSTGCMSCPTRKAVLADITCDSDGKVDRFVGPRDVKRTLELHELRAGRGLLPGRLPGRRLPGDPRAICTTCSATPTSCTSSCMMRAAGGSRRSSRATPPTRARIHGVRRGRTGAGAGARLRARRARGPADAWPESQALKRFYETRTQRLRLPGALIHDSFLNIAGLCRGLIARFP